MELTETEMWEKLKPYLYLREVVQRKSSISIRPTIPRKLMSLALTFTMPCVRCGKTIHPIRKGIGYLAVSCPVTKNINCSKSRTARLANKKIKEKLKNESRNI